MTMIRRARHILVTEGLTSLISRGIKFGFFRYESYYLCQYTLEDHWKFSEADFEPRACDLVFKIISTNEEADELEATGLEFRSHIESARESLEAKAVAFCSFINGEFAHIGWVATTTEAAKALGPPPIKVNFGNNEAIVGNMQTEPKYRRRGLQIYNAFKRLEFCRQHGISMVRVAISTRNTSSLIAVAKVGYEVYAKGYYLRVLVWRFWKEKRLPQTISLSELISKTSR